MSTLSLSYPLPTIIQHVSTDYTVKQISVSWDKNTTANSYNVYRSITDNDFANSLLIGNTLSNSYIDNDTNSFSGAYYWIRGVSNNGIEGYTSDKLYDQRLGINFNQFKLHLYVFSTATSTVSVQYVRGRVWWTNADGTSGDSGTQYFTTVITQTDFGPYFANWSNPDYARLNDSNYTTVTLTGAEDSEDLLFDMGNFGVPDDARVDGVRIEGSGKTSNHLNSYIRIYMYDPTDSFGWSHSSSQQLPSSNTDYPLSIGSSTSIIGQTTEVGEFGSTYRSVISSSGVYGSSGSATIGSWTTIDTVIGSFIPETSNTVLTHGSVDLTFTADCNNSSEYALVEVKTILHNVTTNTDTITQLHNAYFFAANIVGYSQSQSILPILMNTLGNTVFTGQQYSLIIQYKVTVSGSPVVGVSYSKTNNGVMIYSLV